MGADRGIGSRIFTGGGTNGDFWRQPVRLRDDVSTSKPTGSVTIDGVTPINNGDRVLFSNLSGSEAPDNNKVFRAVVSGGLVTGWNLDTDGQPNGSPQDGNIIYVKEGTSFADKIYKWTGSGWSEVGSGGGAFSVGGSGTVQFSTGIGTFNGDTTNFFWDNTNKRLGIGTNTPSRSLTIRNASDSSVAEIITANAGFASFLSVQNSIGAATALFGLENSSGTGIFGSSPAYGLSIGTTGSHVINFATDNTQRWRIDTSGHFNPVTSVTYDIGTGSNRIRTFYGGVSSGTTSAIILRKTSSIYSAVIEIGDGTSGNNIGAWAAVNTPTGSSAYTYLTVNSGTSIAGIGLDGAGYQNAVPPHLLISTLTNHDINFMTNATLRWRILSTGDLIPTNDDIRNLGNASFRMAVVHSSRFSAGDGIASNPSFRFSSSPGTGLANNGTINMHFSINGTFRLLLTGTALTPFAAAGIDLGSSSLRFKDTYTQRAFLSNPTPGGFSNVFLVADSDTSEAFLIQQNPTSGLPSGASDVGTLIKIGNRTTNRNLVITTETRSSGTSGELWLATGDNTGGNTGQLILKTGLSHNNNSGLIEIRTGATLNGNYTGSIFLSTAGSPSPSALATGNITLETGGTTSAGNSGNITLATGIAIGTRGKIKFQDGSEGTIGHVWTSTGTGGEGAWAAPAGTSWYKYTVSHISLQTSSTTNDIELFSLPPKGVIRAVIIKHTEEFAGFGITAYTVSVGITSALQKYATAFDVFQTVGDNVGQTSSTVDFENFSSPTSIRIAAISSGADLDQSTAGSVDVYVLWDTLP